MSAELHPDIEPFAFMLGTWQGTGEGSYPTIEDFGYIESITFAHVGKPFLSYHQRTRDADSGAPLHTESGFWRFPGPGRVEVVLAHPTGLLESLSGAVSMSDNGARFELTCPDIVLTETAVDVERTVRRFSFDGDTVNYDLAMAAVGQPLTHHLAATLRREQS